MKIAVTVCFVPDTASVIDIVDGALDRSRLNLVMNPFDEYALEEAVRVRERHGEGSVTVFSAAPASSKELLRKVLARGADGAVLVPVEDTIDPWQTAMLLSQAVSVFYGDVLPDLVFSGKKSTDFQSEHVPVMLAELLGIASVSGVIALKETAEGFDAEREIENGIECSSVKLPVLFSVEKGLNTPRNASIRAVMDARKKPIEIFPAGLVGKPRVRLTGLEAVVRKKQCRFAGDEKELLGVLANELHLS
ncbi:MAG: electron transfer flavoprotein subunit beta/FixA family protein [Chlorobiaceae bacterium]|nr:electron transfer flavoprotein subunit beta/FixA family protein [Chlorobiaceae bacterium]